MVRIGHRKRTLADPDAEGQRVVAEANGQIVGFLRASVAKPWQDAHREVMRELSHTRLTINVLAVAQAYRRRNIGTTVDGGSRGVGHVVAVPSWRRLKPTSGAISPCPSTETVCATTSSPFVS